MPPPHRYAHFTYVSSCTKYLIFFLNFLFWLFGGLLIGIGLYSGLDKFAATGLIKLDTYYDIILNISIVMVLAGGIVFIVSFCGCLGNAWVIWKFKLFDNIETVFHQVPFVRTHAFSSSTHYAYWFSSYVKWLSPLLHSSFHTPWTQFSRTHLQIG